MSSIDSSENICVAIIGGPSKNIPVYWVFGNTPYEHDYYSNMIANGYQLCFGGGSGEHPCLMMGVADAILWLLQQIDTDNTFSISELLSENEQKEFEAITELTCGWAGEHFEEKVALFYNRVPSFEIDMWPLSTWTQIAKYYSNALGLDQPDLFDFETFMTIASIITLEVYPWKYCDDKRLRNAYITLNTVIANQQKNNCSIQLAGQDFSYEKLKTKLSALSCLSSKSVPLYGKLIFKDEQGASRVDWQCTWKKIENYYQLYKADSHSKTVPDGLLRHFKARLDQDQ